MTTAASSSTINLGSNPSMLKIRQINTKIGLKTKRDIEEERSIKQIDDFDQSRVSSDKKTGFARMKLLEFPSSVETIQGHIRTKVAARTQRRINTEADRFHAIQMEYN